MALALVRQLSARGIKVRKERKKENVEVSAAAFAIFPMTLTWLSHKYTKVCSVSPQRAMGNQIMYC